MKKRFILNNVNCLVGIVLLVSIFASSSCNVISGEPSSLNNNDSTSTPAEMIVRPETIKQTPTLEPKATSTPIITNTQTPTSTSIVTSTMPAKSTILPTTEASCENNLEPVQKSDANWFSILEQVNKLQGFFSLTFSYDGQYVAAVETDSDTSLSHIYLWEVNTGKLLWSVETKEPVTISEIAFSPDETLLVTGATDMNPYVFVWDATSGNIVHKLSYAGRTTKLSFSPDNKYLAIGGLYPANAAIWNLEEETVTSLSNGNGAVFVPTSTEPTLVVYKIWRKQNESSPIYLLNLSSGKEEYLFSGANRVDGAAISTDGQFVSTVNFEDDNITLKVFDLFQEKDIPFEEIDLGFVGINQIDFSSAGHIGVLQGVLNIWDSSGQFLVCLNSPPISGFVFTPDGSHLVTYSGYKAPLTIWKIPVP